MSGTARLGLATLGWVAALLFVILWLEQRTENAGLKVSLAEARQPKPEPVLAPTKAEQIEAMVEEMRRAPGFESASIGLCVLDPRGETIVDSNADRALLPASTLKTITTATALEKLGPDFQFRTRLYKSGEVSEGVLNGNLFLEGGGDPTLSSTQLNTLARELRDKGWLSITGNIIGDAEYFPEAIADSYWDWGDVGNYYGAGASGLNIDYNRCRVLVNTNGLLGDPAKIVKVTPEVVGVEWLNRLRIGPPDSGDNASFYGGPYSATLTARGALPQSSSPVTLEAAVPDPALQAASQLRLALVDLGIEVETPAVTARIARNFGNKLPKKGELLSEIKSPPLIKIIRHLHKESNNLEAECCYQQLGKFAEGNSAKIVRDHWRQRGHEFDGVRFEDGSGLARANAIRPIDLARVLYLTGHGPQGEAYRQTLNVYHDGRVRWKGGAMSSVRGYTGYVTTNSGEELVFALMINQYVASAGELRAWRTKIIEALIDGFSSDSQ